MKKTFVTTLFLLLLLTLSATDKIELTIFTNGNGIPYNVFNASFFDPNNSAQQPVLFTMQVKNKAIPAETVNYGFTLEIKWNDTIILSGEQCQIYAKTALLPNETRNFLSTEIISNTSAGSVNPFGSIPGHSININNVLNSNATFKQALQTTGRFPDGEYKFTLTPYAYASPNLGTVALGESVTSTINIKSPISFIMIYPGLPYGTAPLKVADLFPNFIWFSNMNNYRLKVWELNAQITDIEAIETSTPILNKSGLTESNYKYPQDAPALSYGKTYAWQVSSALNYPTANIEEIKSPIYSFQIDNAGTNNEVNQELIQLLQFLNNPMAMEILNLLNAGYAPSGKIMYKGRELSTSELTGLLQGIFSGQIAVDSITIE